MDKYKGLLILLGLGLTTLVNFVAYNFITRRFEGTVWGTVLPSIVGIILMLIGAVNYFKIPTRLKTLLVIVFAPIGFVVLLILIWGLNTGFKFTM